MKKHDILIQGAIKELEDMGAKSIPGMGGYQYMKHLANILSGRNIIMIDPKADLVEGDFK